MGYYITLFFLTVGTGVSAALLKFTDDCAALFAAAGSHHDEDTPRLVMADWLDEHGEKERAAFQRKAIEAHNAHAASPYSAEVKRIEIEAEQLELNTASFGTNVALRRGLPFSIHFPARPNTRRLLVLWRNMPTLDRLVLTEPSRRPPVGYAGSYGAAALATSAADTLNQFATALSRTEIRLRQLDLGEINTPSAARYWARLANAPFAATLTHLSLPHTSFNEPEADQLIGMESDLANVRVLDIDDSPELLNAMQRHGPYTRFSQTLEELTVGARYNVNTNAIVNLFARGHFPNLRRWMLKQPAVDLLRAVTGISGSARAGELEALHLRTYMHHHPFAAIFEPSGLTGLRQLELSGGGNNGTIPPNLFMQPSPFAASLRELILSVRLPEATVNTLFDPESPYLNLHRLVVRSALSAPTIARLARWPGAGSLRELAIYETRTVDVRPFLGLQQGDQLSNLKILRIGHESEVGNELSETLLEDLAEWNGATSLHTLDLGGFQNFHHGLTALTRAEHPFTELLELRLRAYYTDSRGTAKLPKLNLPKLQRLDVSGMNMRAADARAILRDDVTYPELRVIVFRENGQIRREARAPAA